MARGLPKLFYGEPSMVNLGGGNFLERLNLGPNNVPKLLHPGEVGVLAVFFRPIEYLLSVQIDLQATIGPGGQRDPDVASEVSVEFIRHPRGGRMVLSRYAIDNVDVNFPHSKSPQNWFPKPLRPRLHTVYPFLCPCQVNDDAEFDILRLTPLRLAGSIIHAYNPSSLSRKHDDDWQTEDQLARKARRD